MKKFEALNEINSNALIKKFVQMNTSLKASLAGVHWIYLAKNSATRSAKYSKCHAYLKNEFINFTLNPIGHSLVSLSGNEKH